MRRPEHHRLRRSRASLQLRRRRHSRRDRSARRRRSSTWFEEWQEHRRNEHMANAEDDGRPPRTPTCFDAPSDDAQEERVPASFQWPKSAITERTGPGNAASPGPSASRAARNEPGARRSPARGSLGSWLETRASHNETPKGDAQALRRPRICTPIYRRNPEEGDRPDRRGSSGSAVLENNAGICDRVSITVQAPRPPTAQAPVRREVGGGDRRSPGALQAMARREPPASQSCLDQVEADQGRTIPSATSLPANPSANRRVARTCARVQPVAHRASSREPAAHAPRGRRR